MLLTADVLANIPTTILLLLGLPVFYILINDILTIWYLLLIRNFS